MDPVSCYKNKNIQVEKMHKDQRDTFITSFQNYNWENDPLKLRSIKEAAQVLPDSNFTEPNFAAIKTGVERCRNIIETLVKSHDYARCDELNKLIIDTEKSLKDYCFKPEGNESLLEHIDKNVTYMKGLSI